MPVTWSYKKYKISEICDVVRGKSHFTKNYIKTNQGQYPVYSSQTSNDGEIGKINTYDHDGEFLTWTTDGVYAGTVFYRNGKFSLTSHAGLLEIKEPEIVDYKYLYYLLNKISHRFVNKTANQPMLSTEKMERISVLLPDIQLQKLIGNFLFQLEEVFANKTYGLTCELELRKHQVNFYLEELKCLFPRWHHKILHTVWKQLQQISLEDIKYIPLGELAKLKLGRQFKVKQIKFSPTAKYPLYSSATHNFGEVAKLDTYDYDGEYLTWTNLGVNTGEIFYRNEKFTITSLAGIIENTSAEILSTKYLYAILKVICKSYVNKGGGMAMLGLNVIKQIEIPIIPLEIQEQIGDFIINLEKLINSPNNGIEAEIKLREKQLKYYIDQLF